MGRTSKHSYGDSKIIKYPIITEKSMRLLEKNQYTFIVDRYANKTAIKSAVNRYFSVEVTSVNTCNLPKKQKRVGKYIGWKSQYKKAIVTLANDDIINLFPEN